jgi:hypothetical protein
MQLIRNKSAQINNKTRLGKTTAGILLITEYDISKNTPLASGKKGGRSVGIKVPLSEKVVFLK